MFRLPQRDALINRLGFNNEGLDAFVANVQKARFRKAGAMAKSADAAGPEHRQERGHADRTRTWTTTWPAWTACTRMPTTSPINISSPNTKPTCARCRATRRSTPCWAHRRAARGAGRAHGKRVPLFVKIAPDLDEAQVAVIAATLASATAWTA
jgi:dihydroorotate dehydrogenase